MDKNLNSGNKLEDKPKYIKSSIDNSGNPKKLQEIKKNENLKPVEQKKLESQSMVSDIKLVKCIFEGRSYEILSSVTFDDDKGCYLAKDSSGYTILAYIGENLKEIQRYQNLKSEKIHAKVNEKTEDKTLYLLRIGLQKLIISVEKDDINFVMNL